VEDLARAAKRHFVEHFGREAENFAVAPGRVNLIGEHTDYNDGFVLPMALERYVVLAGSRAVGSDRQPVRLYSAMLGQDVRIAIDQPLVRGEPGWSNYVRGVLEGMRRRGHELFGFDAVICSTVPLGAGLSSSAALEVATLTLLEGLLGVSLPPLDKALLCQKAEHDFAQMPCGLMDQLAAVMGDPKGALLIDCRSAKVQVVPMPTRHVSVLVCNSNVRHSLGDGQYARRRAECQKAAEVLGVSALRDVDLEALLAAEERMDPVVFRRARHVVTENARTVEAAAALTAGDVSRFGHLMYESHRSLRDDFEVSCPELDTLVDLTRSIGHQGGVHGARMTGGGFGGSAVLLVQTSEVSEITSRIERGYLECTSRRADIFSTVAAQGARLLQAVGSDHRVGDVPAQP